MNLQNTPWDYQEHDRIISILAWVVVVVLVIYASVFFYKQITTSPERPAKDIPPATPTTVAPPLAEGTEPAGTQVAVTPPVEQPTPPPPPVATPKPPPPVRPPAPPPPPVETVKPAPPPVAPPKPVETAAVTPRPPVEPVAPVTPPVQPVKPATAPKSERMTLKIGKFSSAGEAVQLGVELGIDGHSFTPVRDPLTNRYTLHFGEFTGWKDAIGVMEAIKSKKASIDVVVWPIPSNADSSTGDDEIIASDTPAPAPPAPTPAPEPPKPAPVRAVEKPRPAPEPAEPAEDAEPTGDVQAPSGPYVVRVASYKVLDNARYTVRLLQRAGFKATLDKTSVRGEPWYRVHVGGFKSQGEAQSATGKISRASHVNGGFAIVKL